MMSDFVVKRPFLRLDLLVERRQLALHGTGIVALVLVLVSSGAFGSDDLPLGRRVLMFGVVATLLITQASVAAEVARRFRVASVTAAAASTVLALATTLALMTLEIHLLKATPIVPYPPDPLPEFALFLLPFVVPVGALVLALKWSPSEDPACPFLVEASSPAPMPRRSELHPAGDRVEDWPSAPVLRMRAVDHYLELSTARGRRLVRGRMQDALRLVAGRAGVQTHRSWWVALDEVERIERHGRDLILLLRCGERLPVARSRAASVKAVLEQHWAR